MTVIDLALVETAGDTTLLGGNEIFLRGVFGWLVVYNCLFEGEHIILGESRLVLLAKPDKLAFLLIISLEKKSVQHCFHH